MTDDKILKQALKKAVKNGYKGLHYQYEKAGIPFGVVLQDTMKIIFSHEFAISFWGEEKLAMCPMCRDITCGCEYEQYILVIAWEYHLGKMVIEKNPLKYIAKFLK